MDEYLIIMKTGDYSQFCRVFEERLQEHADRNWIRLKVKRTAPKLGSRAEMQQGQETLGVSLFVSVPVETVAPLLAAFTRAHPDIRIGIQRKEEDRVVEITAWEEGEIAAALREIDPAARRP